MRLVDADKLIEELNEAQIEGDEFYKGLGKAKLIVCYQPTIDPVKHAEWKEDGCLYKCSNCGNTEEYYDMSYCPCCGARMDGEEENKDG